MSPICGHSQPCLLSCILQSDHVPEQIPAGVYGVPRVTLVTCAYTRDINKSRFRVCALESSAPTLTSQDPASSLPIPYRLLTLHLILLLYPLRNESHNAMKGEIPRPPNAWILYRSDKNAEITAEYAENGKKITQCEVSTTVAQMWRAATPEERAHYEILAEQAKERHAAMYPGYKFQPKKPEQKAKEKAEKALRKATPKLSRARARAQAQPYTSARGQGVTSPTSIPSQFPQSHEVCSVPIFIAGLCSLPIL
jgi:hypothetical protein